MQFKRREFSQEHKYSLKAKLAKARKEVGIFEERSSGGEGDKKMYVKKPRTSASEMIKREREAAQKLKDQEREVRSSPVRMKQDFNLF
jgi:hypothetical protein